MGELATVEQEKQLKMPTPKSAMAEWILNEGVLQRAAEGSQAVHSKQTWCFQTMAEVNRIDKSATKRTVAETIFNCAAIGLTPGAALGHAHFVTFKMNRGLSNEFLACQLIIGYKGFLELVFANSFLKSVQTEVVLIGEEKSFTLERREFGPVMHHPIPMGRAKHYDNVLAAYCTYQTVLGGCDVIIVERGGDDGLDKLARRWKKNKLPLVPMCLKTPIRRAAKNWRITSEMSTAVTLDEMAESGTIQDIGAMADDVIDVHEPSLDDLADGNDDESEVAE